MKPIKDLSKSELLGLIYHYVHGGNVLYEIHPCICAACGTEAIDEPMEVLARKVAPLGYVCDRCEGTEKEGIPK